MYYQQISEVLSRLTSTSEGLSSAEAERRRTLHGENIIEAKSSYSLLRRFLSQFNNILIYILLASAVVTGLMQHWVDMSVILAVTLTNALIGFIQESKSENALAAIRQLLSPQANVLRDGKPIVIDAKLLVPGDIVMLAAGDKVPADLRLLSANSLRLQESILTGESLDVRKSTHIVSEDTPLGNRSCIAYSGTLVTAGQGKGIVIAIGADTEIGHISAILGQVKTPRTSLALKLQKFSRVLAFGIIGLAAFIFLFGIYIRNLPAEEMFMVVIGIAVASIPEGLPAVISITLALGVRAMAKRNAIVRHLPIIESLGNVTVICTDKTGTLTRNELAVSHVITGNHSFLVSGVGYIPEGKFFLDDKEICITDYAASHEMLHGAALNNDATICLKENVWELNGDPTEGALMALALKAGHQRELLQTEYPRQDIIPFSAEQRYMATLHQGKDNQIIYVKGAPERLFPMCSHQLDEEGNIIKSNIGYWENATADLAKRGERVLAIARKHITSSKQWQKSAESELVLLGLFGITDQPREEAKPAIKECYNAGIDVKMITGDHNLTAAAIGAKIGIKNSDKVLTGGELDKLTDEALSKIVNEVNIYARMHPEHKLRLVRALQNNGQIVAMTGDGVNDAPALKMANIGISMGKQGTEVAKEASSIVLADDNFASIVHAIDEGRNIYKNIKRTIQFMLVTDMAEGATLVMAMALGLTLPITPLQILWVNMVTAITLSLAFAFAPHDITVMHQTPLPIKTPLFTRKEVGGFLVHIVLIASGTLGLFLYENHQSGDIAVARTIAVNTLVWFQIYYIWAIFPQRTTHNISWQKHWLPAISSTIGVLLFQFIFTYFPLMQSVFATTALSLGAWLEIIIFTLSILAVLKITTHKLS